MFLIYTVYVVVCQRKLWLNKLMNAAFTEIPFSGEHSDVRLRLCLSQQDLFWVLITSSSEPKTRCVCSLRREECCPIRSSERGMNKTNPTWSNFGLPCFRRRSSWNQHTSSEITCGVFKLGTKHVLWSQLQVHFQQTEADFPETLSQQLLASLYFSMKERSVVVPAAVTCEFHPNTLTRYGGASLWPLVWEPLD